MLKNINSDFVGKKSFCTKKYIKKILDQIRINKLELIRLTLLAFQEKNIKIPKENDISFNKGKTLPEKKLKKQFNELFRK